MRTLSIAPPPGPVTWLFPELSPRYASPGIDIDLSVTPMPMATVAERLRGADVVRVPDGPRGRTLVRILRQVLRADSVAVEADPTLASFETCFTQRAADPDMPRLLPLRPERARDDLEVALRDAAPASVVPLFCTATGHPSVAATRLPESWWGLLQGDAYPDDVRALHHRLLRTVWPDRFLRFRSLENAALAGLDLYDEALRGRFDQPLPAPAPTTPLIFAIDGIDGAGKSTQLQALRDHLEARGLRVASHKMYRHGVFHATITDVTRQCAGDHHLHLWPLQRRAKLFDSLKYYFRYVEPDLARYDALVFDRYVHTHLAAGRGRYGHDPFAAEWMSIYPRADRVWILHLPIEVAMGRIGQRTERTVDENPYMLGRFQDAMVPLAADPRALIPAGWSRESISARIRDDVDRILAQRGLQ